MIGNFDAFENVKSGDSAIADWDMRTAPVKTIIPASIVLRMCQTLERLAVPCSAGQVFDLRSQPLTVQTDVCSIVIESDDTHSITVRQIADELQVAYPRYCRQRRLGQGMDAMINNYRLTGQIA